MRVLANGDVTMDLPGCHISSRKVTVWSQRANMPGGRDFTAADVIVLLYFLTLAAEPPALTLLTARLALVPLLHSSNPNYHLAAHLKVRMPKVSIVEVLAEGILLIYANSSMQNKGKVRRPSPYFKDLSR